MYSGQKVTFKVNRGARGIVKSLCKDKGYVFVVFDCVGDWSDYRSYASERTAVSNLWEGWRE